MSLPGQKLKPRRRDFSLLLFQLFLYECLLCLSIKPGRQGKPGIWKTTTSLTVYMLAHALTTAFLQTLNHHKHALDMPAAGEEKCKTPASWSAFHTHAFPFFSLSCSINIPPFHSPQTISGQHIFTKKSWPNDNHATHTQSPWHPDDTRMCTCSRSRVHDVPDCVWTPMSSFNFPSRNTRLLKRYSCVMW